MNTFVDIAEEGALAARDLPDWLVAHGRSVCTTEEVAYLLGIPKDHVRQRMAALRTKGSIVAAGRGIWVAVPAERRAWGAPEPMAYINELMSCLGTSYMVGWLSAAAAHGASHQAAQVFMVATSRKVRDRVVGRTRIVSLERGYVGRAGSHVLSTSVGSAMVADVATTMLMLASDLHEAGGVDNAATAILELAAENDGWESALAHEAAQFPMTARRRCGWILEELGNDGRRIRSLDSLARLCEGPATRLDPSSPRSGNLSRRWALYANREVEPDL